MILPIYLKEKMKEIEGKHCSPIVITHTNDQVVRMSYVNGEFHWHKHINQDELFYILKGKLEIQLKNRPNIVISEGEMVVIPKGIEHCPKSIEPTFILLFEPLSLQSNGNGLNPC
jgi:quercetin dioxygenase-like cupin family protein